MQDHPAPSAVIFYASHTEIFRHCSQIVMYDPTQYSHPIEPIQIRKKSDTETDFTYSRTWQFEPRLF